MEIIAHRGLWYSDDEKNTKSAFEICFGKYLGTETDVRDSLGDLVICHDIPAPGKSHLTLSELLSMYSLIFKNKNKPTLALNIKSDGLGDLLLQLLKSYPQVIYFCFDMSVPELFRYIKSGLISFTRQSEFEKYPSLYEESAGIWMDIFTTEWFSADIVKQHIANGKRLSFVSSELHKRDENTLWSFIKENNFHLSESLILCTDFPEKAKQFFYE
jgi:hypothetical protein